MTESGSFKTGAPLAIFLLGHNFWKGIGRMFIRIAGQRIQGLELADRTQPVGNSLARDSTPTFDGVGNLCRPQQQGGQWHKNLVLARFE